MKKGFCLIGILIALNAWSIERTDHDFDLVVVGATFSGIAAAINSAEMGHRVALIEEYPHIGGLMTGGLSFTDFLSYEVLGGTFADYMQRVEDYYERKYGINSQQVKDCHSGIHAEPHVTMEIFHQMLAEYQRNITVFTLHRLETVGLNAESDELENISFRDLKKNTIVTFNGKFFIDATYEGDLAAKAGVKYVVGRESRQQYGEVFAGQIYFDNGKILIGSTGQGDSAVQGYNFRLIMTKNPSNRVIIKKPAQYKRDVFLPTAEILKQGLISNVFSEGRDAVLRAQMIPNQKADINDIKNSPVRIALLGKNYDYPDGSVKVREKIIEDHKQHILGFLYFLQNDPEVPDNFRKEAREWGLAKDEFVENGNFPTRLYIREARRIVGRYIFTEHDVRLAPNSIRTKQHSDAIAIGDYALNCHGVKPQGPLYKSISEGDYGHVPPPFQIPFGTIIPNEFNNLLVSVAVSASHVGFSALRLEPTWTALGQAAGIAAHLCLKNNISITDVVPEEVQYLLHKKGAKTIYISDVESNSSYFQAAQYFGTKGFFHHLHDPGEIELVAPKSLYGTQYREAFPFHALEPARLTSKQLADTWINMLPLEGHDLEKAEGLVKRNLSRADFLVQLFDIVNNSEN